MRKFKHYITFGNLEEKAYSGNLGFEELVAFYKVAGTSDLKKMEIIIKNEDWEGFKMLIQKVTGEKLK